MSNYLLELSIVHIVLIAGYWFFLSKERQYFKMRFYLLASTLLAVVIPLLKLPKLFAGEEPVYEVSIGALSFDAMIVAPVAEAPVWDESLLLWPYAAVSTVFLFKFLSALLHLVKLERNSLRENYNGLRIRRVAGIRGSFTFFNWIFLSDEIRTNRHDYDLILRHEKAHASLKHTYDLIFLELFKIGFWWLPTSWFAIKEIKKIHEYQADACALKSCDVDQYSSILISSTLRTNGLNLASSFHEGLIFKRLIAMKQQAKNVSPWKLGMLSALCAVLFIAFACSEDPNSNVGGASQNQELQGEIFRVVEAQPEFKGGADAFFKYLMTEMKYPKEAREKGVEGRVAVEFVVDKDGTLSDVKAVEGIGAGCDEEAVRVLRNAPAFKPGTQNGKPVRVRMIVPIVFKLNEGKSNPDNTTQGIIVFEQVEPRHEKFKVDADYADGEWSGTVYDEQGEPLPGVNVVVIGTTNGTSSGLDGKFRLKAERANDVSLSFIGYETVRLKGK